MVFNPNRGILIILIGILFLIFGGWYLYQSFSFNPDFLPGSSLTDALDGFRISAPKHWRILRIPNTILDYPQSAAQLIQESREAFCIVVPESLGGNRNDFSLDRFKTIVLDAIRKESPEARYLSEEKVPSSWSKRLRIEYESPKDLRKIDWLVQLDWAHPQTYRTLCWCKKENYQRYRADFLQICDSLQPTGQIVSKEIQK